ncbi:3-oxoacyl-ACP synthase [Mesorhizobium sp. M4A.F.Ca.ET.020.02.1.1]|uniref:beta-ketoacyl synthase N-terminal-like domain-containing protein n=1 Tax=unclassified Mesorhizobium TaxID=325217 RepID=UPI000FCC5421|nr:MULTISPECIES: beta-ketoacyl synthase N-terminal-like domain-containing protein [unclassified Mesorhizobium]RUX50224.1 3-oxoacyl-ACP synthase [Mesorhizobium sp. M4A.F.Ca.ET.050.02.1.1]RVD41901.1 3-oxoacyl-ACP synthase [Mesorhizobium sp. M4A.F.Ca.ET.020.02.1.1]RWC19750.1 MAG: 3-oxoacyl-ACP synthase [Mesorhizobium sp.]RWD30912.1 MAG: 3-oxoacyl-ACP synthase [Mesorhizobium sp.]TIW26599.1 MAG: 3-oxoacyl-ACP synthase [Mesorhizobium sp.]
MSASLDIESIGMVTAVGLDAPSSCAAMRARLDGFQETQFIGAKATALIGAPVTLPRNWIGAKRLAHMAAGAISEAINSAPRQSHRMPVLLCLAEDDRAGRPYGEGSALLRKIGEIVQIEPHDGSRIIAHGRPAGHAALEHARKLLSSGQASSVVVAGVDSYLTSGTIAHYLDRERLLTVDNPNGFLPGEAAAAVVCTKPKTGGFRVSGIGLARERAEIYNRDDRALRGDGMTEAYRAALNEAGIEMRLLGYRIADLVGEQYWFKQNALASLRLLRGRHEFQDIWSPAESLGNVGAAVVPLMLGMAFEAARKGYAAGNPVLIEASNDAGACGAAVLLARAS